MNISQGYFMIKQLLPFMEIQQLMHVLLKKKTMFYPIQLRLNNFRMILGKLQYKQIVMETGKVQLQMIMILL